jgi:hypothetical protein
VSILVIPSFIFWACITSKVMTPQVKIWTKDTFCYMGSTMTSSFPKPFCHPSTTITIICASHLHMVIECGCENGLFILSSNGKNWWMDGCFSHYLNERSLFLIWGEFVVFQVAQQQESLLCFSWLNVKWVPPWVVFGLHDLERNFICFIKKISHPNWSYLLILFRGREEEASC